MSTTTTRPTPATPLDASEIEESFALDFEHITKRYSGDEVVADLSFTVHPGRVTGFLGPNGAGKSTTMKILLGLASADEGNATIGGHRYRDLPDPAGTVGAVVETDAFHPGRSGRNHLQILADASGVAATRVDEMLELVELDGAGQRRAGAYSLGMRQRLGLAAALLLDPPVLVLDEPGNGLDPQGVRALRGLLRDRAARGHTVLVSSHLLSEVEHLADDVVVVHHGQLVTQGSLEELRHGAALVRCTDTDTDTLKSELEAAGAAVEATETDTLVVRGLEIDDVGERAFRAGIPLHELSPHAGSLEDMFFNWTTDRDGAPAGAHRRPGPDQQGVTS